ncbi:MAG: UDP-glucose--hexose-1-phosphate uridylyltransferase [Bacilli bacterium]|nr:UDP-glucose--hexose-1-phosphate uridylyltransferase [Bacilli bacterium]MDD4077592.1 UDP-glucose--hexose-1-phosphate uridylyltransferase [Bacilli bacterium]MDD4388504.1 UDP-glucose--hexose-1-phosphate uridylyltransferase [Bacilli bacterium]
MKLITLVNELLDYGLQKNILDEIDFDYSANLLIDLFQEKNFRRIATTPRSIDEILEDLACCAYEKGIIESDDYITYDNFKAKTADMIIDRPSGVIKKFYQLYQINPHQATDYLYKLSKGSNYIQTKRIKQNIIWHHQTEYGTIELTINLSKPEKDPKLIALQKLNPVSQYPQCRLCKENQGYRGHLNYDSRSNMRIIPLKLAGETWYFQYSPYSYFDEHSIVLNEHHIPMIVNRDTFRKLLDFLDLFPEYFVGSNAGLPIVGGSILNHEHYQAGRYHFPIEKAKEIYIGKVGAVDVSRLIWPLSTIRIKSADKEGIIDFAAKALDYWMRYENPALSLINNATNPHHTLTPIARKEKSIYVFDLILRSNYTNALYPDGVFHPHPELYHIKKENIGLIEAMGMGILPGRLKKEFELIAKYLSGEEAILADKSLEKHHHWIEKIKPKFSLEQDVDLFILNQAGKVFSQVLMDAGVFKMDHAGESAFIKFANALYYK